MTKQTRLLSELIISAILLHDPYSSDKKNLRLQMLTNWHCFLDFSRWESFFFHVLLSISRSLAVKSAKIFSSSIFKYKFHFIDHINFFSDFLHWKWNLIVSLKFFWPRNYFINYSIVSKILPSNQTSNTNDQTAPHSFDTSCVSIPTRQFKKSLLND